MALSDGEILPEDDALDEMTILADMEELSDELPESASALRTSAAQTSRNISPPPLYFLQ